MKIVQSRWICILVLIIDFVSCHSDNHYFKINGIISSTQYDGEWMYLVPIKNANAQNVDSCMIRNGVFSFEGTKERVSILRAKPVLRLCLQPLLVITEPGKIKVKIDSVSSSEGTKQNDALQQWKVEKEKFNVAHFVMLKKLKFAKLIPKDSIQVRKAMKILVQKEFIFDLSVIKEQKCNTLANFIYYNIYPFSSQAQKTELNAVYHDKTTIRRQ